MMRPRTGPWYEARRARAERVFNFSMVVGVLCWATFFAWLVVY